MTDKYSILKERKKGRFDTFLCHNSKDKAEVMELFNELLDVGILAWIDQKELEAGSRITHEIEEALKKIPSAVVVLGEHGQGIFQEREYENIVRGLIYESKKVVPVILKNCLADPDIPGLLGTLVSVDFRDYEQDNLAKLYKGITGKDLLKPKVFIAEVHGPLEKDRNILKEFLKQFKIKTLPEKSNFNDPKKIDKSIEDCLEQADLFVQILDKYEWKLPGEIYNGCLVKAQYNAAIRKLTKNKIFRWTSTDHYPQITEDDTETIRTGRFEDFKYEIRDEAEKLLENAIELEYRQRNPLRIRPKIFVRRVEADSELAKDIFSKLSKRYNREPSIKIRYLTKFNDTDQKEKFLRKMIKTCAVQIIIYANSGADWVDEKVDESDFISSAVKRETLLPIRIIKHPEDKEADWMQEDDYIKFIAYTKDEQMRDIDALIREIDTILESNCG
jgi:hypothetical protein